MASSCSSLSRTILLVTLSGTKSPLSMYFFASSPSGVPPLTLARKMSPVEIATTPRRSEIRSAWVPLPDPGGPIINILVICESFVVPLLKGCVKGPLPWQRALDRL